MLINNNHIQGIFVYSPSAEYERGDFIVESGILYICTATNPTNKEEYTVQGKIPSQDKENFNIYLGDRITTPQEFFDYISNPDENRDKYISSFSLSGILNSYMLGFDEKGIIEDLKYIPGETINPLDEIINSEEVNNATYSISRNSWFLKDLGFITSSDYVFYNSKYIMVPIDKIILRQYSYKERINEEDKITRVQELIDPLSGETMYRWGRLGDSIVSSWKTSFPGTYISEEEITSEEGDVIKVTERNFKVKERFDAFKNYYSSLIKKDRENLERLVGNFSYREVNLGSERSEKVILQTDDSKDPGYIDFGSTQGEGFNNSQPKSMVIDIVIRTVHIIDTITYQKNKSITLDLRDFEEEVPINNYYIDDQTSVIVEKDNMNHQVTLTISSNSGDSKFVNIYYRKQYENG